MTKDTRITTFVQSLIAKYYIRMDSVQEENIRTNTRVSIVAVHLHYFVIEYVTHS